MKTKLIKTDLQKAVSIANRFVPLKPTLPVLANILLKAEKGKLIIKTTNLESSVILEIPAKSEDTWEITTPARILNEFLNLAKDKEVNLSLDKENLLVESGDASGSIAGIAATEFPSLPTIEGKNKGVEFKQKTLQEAVGSVAFAASVDEGKPVLNGILLMSEGDKTIVVATDGYRLAKKELSGKSEIEKVIVPAKVLTEALKIAGEMEEEKVSLVVSPDENQLLLRGDSFQVSSRLISGVYPQFTQIIPKEFKNQMSIKKDYLVDSVKVTAVFARDLGNVVKLFLKQGAELKITANTLQIGEGSTGSVAKITGEELVVAFNSHYFLDGLSAIKEETLTIKFSGALSPTLIKGETDETFIYIVMPVKPQN